MTWLLVTSTALSIASLFYNVFYVHEWPVVWWQGLDIGGSALFLAAFFLGMRGRLSARARWLLSPGYFAFWLVLMTGYYFQTLPFYGENMLFVVGVVTPTVLILLPPRVFLSLLFPTLAVYWGIHLAVPSVNEGRTVAQIFGSLMNGSLAVFVGMLAAWFLYSARKANFEKERLLETRASDLRRAESHMRAILENIPFQAWLKDVNGRFLAVNRFFAEAHGKPAAEIVHKEVADIYPPERAEQYRAEDIALMASREPVHLEQSVEFPDGRVWYEVFKSPVIDDAGNCLGTAGLARDITERREVEERIMAADRAKSEFLAAMSHEIRTPMNSVLGYAQLLQELPLDDMQREYVESILGSGRILLHVINDILDFSKIEAGQMTLSPATFALRPLLQRCVRMFEPQAAAKGVTLRLELADNLSSHLHADPARIEQILINLLSNAVKFTERGSVTLVAREDEAAIHFEVRDTGIGIAPDQLARLFQPFSQADTAISRRFSGTGLGLVITQRLCDLMGGSITVQSAAGVGSCFTAMIPLAPAHPDDVALLPPAEADPSSLDLSRLRVLVVEDNAVNRRLVSAILRRWNVRTKLAASGAEALRLVQEERFDVILMDVQMPEMDGLEATRLIRNWETSTSSQQRARIIALTGLAMAGDQERCRDAGMDDYLTKPIHTASLGEALARAQG